MSEMPSETTVRAWARLMRAQQIALAAIEHELKQQGLPPLVWYDVLLEVECAGTEGLRPFELERAMLLAQYNLSRLVDRIERAGYVERRDCAQDGRGQMVAITEQGKAMRRKMWPVYARAIEAALGQHLTARQIEMLDDVIGRLIERSREAATG
jgi:DNA-binding MarR family transcriptional regulator